MSNLEWQTVAAIISAVAAVVAAGLSIYTVRRSLRISALVALEQRFAAINHANIANRELRDEIDAAQPLKGAAKHLVFELFQFYHQAFLLHKQGAINDADYGVWRRRLETDLELFAAYRNWWTSDQPTFHTAWNEEFVKKVNEILGKTSKKTEQIGEDGGHRADQIENTARQER